MKAATAGGQGIGVQYGHGSPPILNNGLGRYEQALVAAQDATAECRSCSSPRGRSPS